MSNKIEDIIYGLPLIAMRGALEAGEKSDDCCTVYCESIDVISDYISQLQLALKSIAETAEQCDGWESFPIEEINRAYDAIEGKK